MYGALYIVHLWFSGCTMFYHTVPQTARFSQTGLKRKRCVLTFRANLSKTFLILRRTERRIVANVQTSSCKVPVILVRF